VLDKERAIANATAPVSITLSGQVETMRESFGGLFSGMAMAVILVYLALVINFQSWGGSVGCARSCPVHAERRDVDAVSHANASEHPGVDGFLDVYRPHLGQQHSCGDVRQSAHGGGRRQGYRRDRCGLYQVAAGVDDRGRHDPRHDPDGPWGGRGGEQNAPLARAVIGGLLFATAATMIFVPVVYRMLRRDLEPWVRQEAK